MIILPSNDYKNYHNEKISTYQFLARIGCPVFDSILLEENEDITEEKVATIRKVLCSNYCTLRYQYIRLIFL